MIRVGITGQPGFVGTHLFEALGQQLEKFKRIPFEDAFFEDELKLRAFVKQCDVIVHLAAMMRSPIEEEVYRVNMRLVHQFLMRWMQKKWLLVFFSLLQYRKEMAVSTEDANKKAESYWRTGPKGIILVLSVLFFPIFLAQEHVLTLIPLLLHSVTS